MTFRPDLYRGTAGYYDKFQVPYPQALLDHLSERAVEPGSGTLLDLACGPGTIAFALRDRFAQVWAVDQEPGMIAVARAKAGANVRCVVSAAEEFTAPVGTFDLVTIGNAFHRLRREAVAAAIFRWLRPGGHVAVLRGGSPWYGGDAPWQQAMTATQRRWMTRTGSASRVPAGHKQQREQHPDPPILQAAGFQLAGRHEFPVSHEWTVDSLAGFYFSTSVLSREALGDHAADFEADLRRELLACEPSGVFRQQARFAYELATKPRNPDS
jgi:ubiquinone/menaquinone biosynthesis C-methylase UbiE